MLGNLGPETGPVVPVATGHLGDAPHVGLEDALGDGGSGVGLVVAVHLSDGIRLGEGGEVDRLENLSVQLLRLGGVEGHAEEDENVRETLHTETDGAVAHVGAGAQAPPGSS